VIFVKGEGGGEGGEEQQAAQDGCPEAGGETNVHDDFPCFYFPCFERLTQERGGRLKSRQQVHKTCLRRLRV